MADKPGMAGLVIEPASPSDMAAGAKVFARAMQREDALVERQLHGFSRRLARAGIGRFIVARLEGRPVGFGSLAIYGHVGWIGFMGTEPDVQGRGVGSAVMKRLLGMAAEAGLKTLKLDATNVGENLYSKFGFKKEYPARRFGIPGRCTRGTRRETHGGSVRITDSLPCWCSSLDLRAFGDDRSNLIRHSLKQGAKLLSAGRRGFGLLEGKKLGPVVAMDTGAALDLVFWASNLGASVIYVAEHPRLPREFLAALRAPEQDGPITCCLRMSRGEAVEQDLSLVYADYSAATG
jgi:GNAT superfamily N-acetyltransferase